MMMYFFDCGSVIKRTADIANRDAPRAVTVNGAAAGAAGAAGVAVATVFAVGVRVLPLVWFLKELHGVVVVVVVVVVDAARAAAIAAADPGGGVPGTPLPVR